MYMYTHTYIYTCKQIYMLDIALDKGGEPIIDAQDFTSLARAASTETPELLTYSKQRTRDNK